MKKEYTYRFNNENITIEINERDYELLKILDNEEFNSNRKHTRRYPISLDRIGEDDSRLMIDIDILGELIKKSDIQFICKAIQELMPQQRELIYKIYYCEHSIISIANEEMVTEAAIRNRLKKIYRKLEKVLTEGVRI